MNIDEVIDALSKIRAEHGNLTVLVYNGNDPSDLCEVDRVERTSTDYWWGAHGGGEVPAVRLTT